MARGHVAIPMGGLGLLMFAALAVQAGAPGKSPPRLYSPAQAIGPADGQKQVPPEQARPKSTESVAPSAKGPVGPAIVEAPVAAPPCTTVGQQPGWLVQQLPGPAGDMLSGSGINIRGWIDQGFTWNPDSPDDRFNFPVTFNDRANEYQLNQLYLILEKPVNTAGCCWDYGGRVDVLYGTDYYFTEATGLELEQDGTQKWNSEDGPRFQLGPATLYGVAMPQLYAEIFAPIGNGATIKIGHFYTIIGYEVVPAPNNYFYSHALTNQYGEPFTHTGVLATYNLSDTLTVHSGLTFGWDSFTNPDDDLAYLGGIQWTSCDQRSSIAYAVHVGDEPATEPAEVQDIFTEHTRFVQSIVLTQKIGCNMMVVVQSDYGHENNGSPFGTIVEDGIVRFVPKNAEWYGVNARLIYEVSKCLSAAIRAEWFRDDDHARIIPIGDLAEGGNYYEITAGLHIRPLENLLIRPELRWDWSDVDLGNIGLVGPYDDFSDKNQFTLAVDAIVKF